MYWLLLMKGQFCRSILKYCIVMNWWHFNTLRQCVLNFLTHFEYWYQHGRSFLVPLYFYLITSRSRKFYRLLYYFNLYLNWSIDGRISQSGRKWNIPQRIKNSEVSLMRFISDCSNNKNSPLSICSSVMSSAKSE